MTRELGLKDVAALGSEVFGGETGLEGAVPLELGMGWMTLLGLTALELGMAGMLVG